MKLGNYKGRKVEETGFSKKFFIWRYSQKGLQISIGWLVGWLTGWLVGWLVGWLDGNVVFSETALSIFLTFCIKLGYYKARKVTEAGFLKKVSNLAKNRHFDIFFKNGSNNFFGFWS